MLRFYSGSVVFKNIGFVSIQKFSMDFKTKKTNKQKCWHHLFVSDVLLSSGFTESEVHSNFEYRLSLQLKMV